MTTPAHTSACLSPTSWQQLRDRVLTVEAIRRVDQAAVQRYHMHPLVLMENAALGCVHWLLEHFPQPRHCVVLCGRGNNGGDGLAIMRHLRLAGWQCTAVVLGPIDRLSSDARSNWNVLTARHEHGCLVVDGPEDWLRRRETIATLFGAVDLVIDAMLGSGAEGPPRSPLADWVQLANAANAHRVAIDIPTGLDATTGRACETTFRAKATLTFVARKPGFLAPEAQEFLGQVVVLPIGIPVELVDELLATESSDGRDLQ